MTSKGFRYVWLLYLIVTLLAFQQGAAVHALSHLAENTHAQAEQEEHLPHSPACEECMVYATIGGAITASSLTFQDAPGVVFGVVGGLFLAFFAPLSAYRSRAPPHFL